jgi:biotin transport system substrate-specific component
MKLNVKEMILAALFAALTAVGAFIEIPLGPVSFTLQILFTALAGIMLGAKLGALSQLVYVVIGLLGLPIFSGRMGGLAVISKPSFGYLLGFIAGAYVIGKIAEGTTKPSFIRLFIASLVGIAVIYAIGVPYLYFIINNVIGKSMTFMAALKTGLIVFIPGDLIKCFIAAALGTRVVPAIKKAIY